jgi:ABC-type nitrate/sulfonate/bicarbonate transport system substrate-binding protein
MKLLSKSAARWAIAAVIGLAGITGGKAEEVKTVKMGITPYFDYMPWVLAKDMGFDKELGLDIALTTVTTTPQGVAAMKQGSLDVVSSCHVCDFPLYKSVPSLRSWLITDQFKGFIIIGRKGAPTFSELSAKVGPEKAKEEILKGFKGKTFPLMPASFRPLLSTALSQVDMSVDDVSILEFADDAQAALAFQRGEGDYYMGSLTQEIKLLGQGDKFVNVGGQEILGPAGLWYSTMISTKEWLDANQETALKLTAIWFRTTRYMNGHFDAAAPKLIAINNERAAASFTPDDFKTMYELLTFPTVEQAKETVFNPDSGLYWKRSVDFYAAKNAGDLAGASPDDKALEGSYFDKLVADQTLIDWINKPFN